MSESNLTDLKRRRLLQACAILPGLLSGGLVFAQSVATRKKFKVFLVIHREGTRADEGFMEYLKSAGLNVEFVVRNIAGDAKLLPGIVEEIRQQKPDLIYTQSTDVTKGVAGEIDAKNPEKFIRDIPVVFSMVGDPIGAKLVRNLEKPERNLTGAIHVISMAVQLNSMKQYLPIKRLGIIYVKSEATQRKTYDQLKKLTDAQGIELVAADPLGADGTPQAESIIPMLDRMAAFKPDLVYVPNANFFGTHSKLLMEEALKRKLPTFCALEPQIESGGLMGSVAKLINVGALAGFKAEQILLGKKTAQNTPIEVLPKFSFIVNIDTARILSLYPPMQVLRFAQIVPEPRVN